MTFLRSVEIEKISSDLNDGKFNIEVFGATERASPLNLGSQSKVLSSAYYSATGTDLSTLTTYFTDVGGVLHLDTDGYTMAGNASINNSAAHYYADSDLVIDATKTLGFTQNVLLKVNGTLTINGTLNGAGQGLSGATFSGTGVSGTSGFFGTTHSGGGVATRYTVIDETLPAYSYSYKEILGTHTEANGRIDNPPRLNIINNAGTLEGLPNDLRATSGGSGRQSSYIVRQGVPFGPAIIISKGTIDGGDGGAGGATIVIVCEELAWGVSGKIITSGAEGSAGNTYTLDNTTSYGGKGASGHPGAVYVLIDGNTAGQPDNQIEAYLYSSQNPHAGETGIGHISSRDYFGEVDRYRSCFVVQRIPDDETAVEDQPDFATTSSKINVSAPVNTANLVNVNIYEITTTAPSDTNWYADAVYWRTQGAADWTKLGVTNGSNELKLYAAVDAGTIELKAHPISQKKIESPDYIEEVLTVSTTVATTLGTGGKLLIGSATDYFSGNGIALVDDGGTAKAHIGDPAGQYWRWTGSALDVKGNITADTITTDSGTIGGWTILSDRLSSGSFALVSDSKYLAIGNVTFGQSGIQLQYNLGTPRIYIGDGSTKYFKYTTGGDVEVGGGTLHETVYEVYTSGLIRSDASPSTNGGFQLDNNGLRLWDSSGNLNVDIDTTAAKIILSGLSKIVLDSLTGEISINNSTFGQSGIQLQYNSGAPQSYIGDGADNYIQYTNSGGLELGDDVIFNAGSSYENDNIYYDGYFPDYEYASTNSTESGQGYITLAYSGGTASAYILRSKELATISWGKKRAFKMELTTGNTTSDARYIGSGLVYTTNGRQINFRFAADGYIYAYTADGTSNTSTQLQAYSASTDYKIEFHSDGGSNVYFYVDDILKATHTSSDNLPSGTTSAGYLVYGYCAGNSIQLGRFKFRQQA